jgi:hypothetical protein
MGRAIPPLANTPSWRGAQLKHRVNFTFTIKYLMDFLALTGNMCCMGVELGRSHERKNIEQDAEESIWT